ncbi:hydroxymethylglutaryl-CoA lyase [Bradyrhizobium sp. LHD-71]|uniref:hydroxymethylglutaryl-CoA lyase n=1 Tax=Bradyrhizobium sp. LHD-71 TaxID=3072141 RepID=UPI00280F377E|nr:hydroxymethylglutaryl-CoA lyase [Bradyrhizobium sp. LHD-71]MDQ8728191.1 hydroxymethylglutaryl-CoA lyase [Bradyrhizobium sp. LHD-71]
MSDSVVLSECFVRDGLQHETCFMPTPLKVALIERFLSLGFPRIEATSFTHPGNVPQFNDADEVLRAIPRSKGVGYKATCINMRSVERAMAASDAGHGPDEVSVILCPSDMMSQRAFRRTRAVQHDLIRSMVDGFQGRFTVIGTISFAFGSPVEAVAPQNVIDDAIWLYRNGVRHLAVADTAGMGTPRSVAEIFKVLRRELPDAIPIAHFHDTRGLGLTNCLAAYEEGVRHFDCAFGGAGGSPAKINYFEGYTGNVCTEDLINMFETIGVRTNIDLARLIETAKFCEESIGRELHGRVTRSGLGQHTEEKAA